MFSRPTSMLSAVVPAASGAVQGKGVRSRQVRAFNSRLQSAGRAACILHPNALGRGHMAMPANDELVRAPDSARNAPTFAFQGASAKF
jgi:hypothetical protein